MTTTSVRYLPRRVGNSARTRERWAQHDAPHLDAVRAAVADGATLAQIGQIWGARSPEAARQFLLRNDIEQHRKRDTRGVVVLIEPVRWPTGRGIQGSGGFDVEDTGEL
jgi:hypothetical protein